MSELDLKERKTSILYRARWRCSASACDLQDDMKIAVAQTKPKKGDVSANIEHHKTLIQLAADHNADLLIFPELSLTGYEPTLAKELATDPADHRFNDFQKISDESTISIGVGMPIRNNGGVSIGMIIFQPRKERQVYVKKFLHADEDPFFVPGENLATLQIKNTKIALAICFEISIDEHTKSACSSGDAIYIASVAKSVAGINNALTRLSQTARNYSTLVLMSNSVGTCDNEICAGRSSIWNTDGTLLFQLDTDHEGILIVDPATREGATLPLL
jgi:predicted amidohydrolase